MVGANGGSSRVPGAGFFFPKLLLDHLGCSNKYFSPVFELMVPRCGPWKIPTCLEDGPFWDQKWVKNGSKTCFFKSDTGPFGVHNQVK